MYMSIYYVYIWCTYCVQWYEYSLSCIFCFQDFGDYSENFYSVQTNEGEKISQLIAMYIDIIMQKKKPLHTDVPEDEDEPVIVESDIDSQRWAHTIM